MSAFPLRLAMPTAVPCFVLRHPDHGHAAERRLIPFVVMVLTANREFGLARVLDDDNTATGSRFCERMVYDLMCPA